MTRFVVDASVVLYVASEGIEVAPGHELLAPTLIRSQLLSSLHEAVHRGELSEEEGRARLEQVSALKLRLLGDLVLRRLAWKYATALGWPETYAAEYLALTKLQADAFVTLDEELARAAATLVPVASVDALTR